MMEPGGSRRKLIVFTEHRDTSTTSSTSCALIWAVQKPLSPFTVSGSRRAPVIQERFTQDKDCSILVATDAAGEASTSSGTLLINYDLP